MDDACERDVARSAAQVPPITSTSMATATRTRLAKLTRPASAATYSRTRLFEELDKADAAPVVWVVGPPGSGKTTLIADYTATRRLPGLWYQVDRGEADIASFFFYLGQAVQGELRVAIDELPQGGRLFIISRLSPPTGFARLRARGRLRLIGWAELRLTLEEAAGVAAVRNGAVNPVEVERLHARTHGWAAGFILLLQNREVCSSAV